MRLFAFIFIVLLSSCASVSEHANKEKPKDDPYSDSTLNNIKANQGVYIEQQRHKGYF